MTEHYYSEKQTSILRIKDIEINLRGNTLKFSTGSGVFSIGKIDKGTDLLIKNCIVKDDWEILDLGCGWGPVGISIAKDFPSTSILMIDINQRAVKLSKMNVKLNGIRNIKVKQSNIYNKIDKKFDTIITNPPQTAGKQVCFEMIEKAKNHLKENGLLQVVARHNKGGKQLEKKMKETFNNVEPIAKKSGYRVYLSKLTKP